MSKEREDVLFENLMAAAENPRLKTSIERVKEACNFLEQSQAAITPTSVGRYCDGRWGGPKAQSIRNARETLLRYVETRQGLQSLPTSPRRDSGEPVIHDETVKAYVSLLRAERDEAIRLKNRIIAGLRKVPGIPIDDLIGSGFKGVAVAPPQKPADPSAAATSALLKLLDADHLAKVGMELHRHRMRNRITGEVLLDKPDVEALRLLATGSGETAQSLELTHERLKALK
ncbi:hypothetical protein ACQ858_09580 [Variovorax ureilyticus]|uniref:hypothetical protein n=1 Tax=Variovorax ureilyticus TaxID=1836198 RepID=UPI003D666777